MNRITCMLAGSLLAVVSLGSFAHAQQDPQRLVAKVPFEFAIGSTSFPAGQYEFIRMGAYELLVRNADGRSRLSVASALFQDKRLSDRSQLKFATVDGHYVLVQIWNGRSSVGNEFSVPTHFLGRVQDPTR